MKRIGNDIILNKTHVLTEKEQSVLFGLADGKTPPEIAEELHCDTMLLRNIEMKLIVKLGAKSKTHLISRAFSLGLLMTRTLCLMLILSQISGGYNNNWTRIARTRPARTRTTRTARRV